MGLIEQEPAVAATLVLCVAPRHLEVFEPLHRRDCEALQSRNCDSSSQFPFVLVGYRFLVKRGEEKHHGVAVGIF